MIFMGENAMVSVIVPVYNNEIYLDECISSIINQTYSDIQIILINDGSKDRSLEICKKYAGLDKRILIINQLNLGVSQARNAGLELAEGEFICFVDSDDVLPPDSIEKRIVLLAGSGSEMCVCDFVNIDFQSRICKSEHESICYTGEMSSHEFMNTLFDYSIIGYQGYLWNKLFRACIISGQGIKFADRIHYNEDRLFVLEYLTFCNKVEVNDQCVYWYRINPESAMGRTGKLYTEKMLTELEAYMEMGKILKQMNLSVYARAMKAALDSSVALNRIMPGGHKDKDSIKEFAEVCLKEYHKSKAGNFITEFVLLLKYLLFIKK